MDYSNEIIQDIINSIDEEIYESRDITYEVWATGFSGETRVDNSELLLKTFKTRPEAVTYAKNLTLADIVQFAAEVPTDFDSKYSTTDNILVEVESVIVYIDGESDSAGTIFSKCIFIGDNETEEVVGTEEPEVDFCEDVVQLTSNDYTVFKDGSLVVPCNLLKGYNKNDYVKIRFIDEDATPLIIYKISNRITGDFEGADAFICEFEY